eukprot:4003226-Ditylum_brightwellii.AAC.1
MMAKDKKSEPELEEVTSLTRKEPLLERGGGRGPGQKTLRFQGSCEELRGWDKIAQHIAIKFTYGTELKNSIDKLKPITLTTPTTMADGTLQIEKDIYKEEVMEYVREKKALERVSKQAYALVWGQCSRPMHKKIKTMQGFDTIADDKDMIK